MKNLLLILMIFLTLPVHAQESKYCHDPETSPLSIFTGSGNYDFAAGANRVSIKEIELAGNVAEPTAELSGLAWYDDNLFLLPQYPDRFASTTYGALFYIPKHEIFRAIDTDIENPLMPESIDLHVADLSGLIPGFEGFESIVFVGQTVYMTIEASSPSMRGYIISGTICPDLSGIFLDTSTLQEIELGGAVPNASYESISFAGGKLLTFYEANGANISQNPLAHVLSANLDPETPISFPNIEYRVTDATNADEEGYFWIINYMYPGDEADYRPSNDTFSEISCVIPDPSGRVERLIELRYTENGIVPTDRAPIDLVLENHDISRNWEGIARLDDCGFILATDKFPKTMLAFVQMPVHGCGSFPNPCSLTINQDLTFTIPNAIYDPGPLAAQMELKVDFQFFGEQNGQLLWQLINADTSPSSVSCPISIAPDLSFTLTDVAYDAGPSVDQITLQADFQYSGEKNGVLLWYLADYIIINPPNIRQ